MKVRANARVGWLGSAVALLACACGSRAASPSKADAGDAGTDASDGAAATSHPDFTSGTRLRARTWVADGVTLGIDTSATVTDQVWYDQQLGVPCTFVTRAGGARCEPVPAYLDPARGSFPVYGFADATCGGDRVVTGPVGSASSPWRDAYCAGKRYARVLEPAGDTLETNPYEVGAALAGTSWYMRPLDQPDQCVPIDVVQPADFRRAARKAAASEFVGAHLETISSGRRLSPIMLVADDGARQRVGWHDEQLGVDCAARPAEEGKTRCLPNAGRVFVLPSFFGGDDCRLVLAIPSTADVKAGDLVKAEQVAPGINLDSFYRLGPQATKIYERSANGDCVEAISFGNAFPLIDELPVSRLDELTPVTREAGGLRTTSLVDAEGTVDHSNFTMVEATSGAACTLLPTNDGKMRCLPSTTLFVRYGDAACMSAAPLVSVVTGAAPPAYAMRWKGDVCSGGYELTSIGAAAVGPERTYDTNPYGVGCTLNPFARPDTLSYYALGQPVALDEFPAVELVTE